MQAAKRLLGRSLSAETDPFRTTGIDLLCFKSLQNPEYKRALFENDYLSLVVGVPDSFV
jgi:hypothetical protein